MKIIVIIQARMGSTRLPGKIMLPFNNKPLIMHMIESFEEIKEIDKVIVATSINKENEPFVKYLEENSISYFRGSENDVLSRFVAIIEKENPDIIVRATADDPLMSTNCLKVMLSTHISKNADYTFMKGLPVGISPEVVNAHVLTDIYRHKELSDRDKEHVTIYLKEHEKQYMINYMEANGILNHPELSLTVDTKEEYETMENLFSLFKDEITLEKVITYLLDERKS